ncbi:hypothetical protein COY14_05115 [Candidatus Roizmanbacteria bacterium CG_4_10_14_0_2_um_filter_36_9]|nr:MAG: hypothetical protein COY14_05115 [Candidatus Roizmanbacteria bacterium CG_4_10_14_0_2_um_filter_36_9]
MLTHNALAVIYSLGIVVSTCLLFYKPTRAKVLILWGFVILLFAFEYEKHILEGLKEQTINSLITERQSVKIEYYVTKILTKAVPFVLPIIGWVLVIAGAFYNRIETHIFKIIDRNV